jgi:YD repeat-containing protein
LDVVIAQKISCYALFSNHPSPSTTERYEYNLSTGSWVLKGTFNTYDASGNPTQYTQTGWQPENFTWQNGLIKTRNFQNHTTTYNPPNFFVLIQKSKQKKSRLFFVFYAAKNTKKLNRKNSPHII